MLLTSISEGLPFVVLVPSDSKLRTLADLTALLYFQGYTQAEFVTD